MRTIISNGFYLAMGVCRVFGKGHGQDWIHMRRTCFILVVASLAPEDILGPELFLIGVARATSTKLEKHGGGNRYCLW